MCSSDLFFILQAHYRSTVDFSNAALQSAEKALAKMIDSYSRLQSLQAAAQSSTELADYKSLCYEAMNDDLNTPQVIAHLFDACRVINSANSGDTALSQADIDMLKELFDTFLVELLGIRTASSAESADDLRPYAEAVDLLMEIRAKAKSDKDWATSDLIRDRLAAAVFDVKDTKNGVEWSLK